MAGDLDQVMTISGHADIPEIREVDDSVSSCLFFAQSHDCLVGMDKCKYEHIDPSMISISKTLLLRNLYQYPADTAPIGPDGLTRMNPRLVQKHFEHFYEDMFETLAKYGEIEFLGVCDNLADHLAGSVYVKFRDERGAADALEDLGGWSYEGRQISVEFSPTANFAAMRCRRYDRSGCHNDRCRYMHSRPISKTLRKGLYKRYKVLRKLECRRRRSSGAIEREF